MVEKRATAHQMVADSLPRLARLPLFREVAPEALAGAAAKARWISPRPGELVIEYGDATDDVFLVEQGVLRVLVRTPMGQEAILGDLGAGAIFGELAALDGAPRSASVTALNAARLCRLPGRTFREVLRNCPDVALRVLQTLAARLREQDQRNLELVYLPARHRLAAELLRLSRLRGGAAGRVISPPPAQHVLAARIGARRETVSLALGEIAREGLAEVSLRAIVLPQPEALQAQIDAALRGEPAGGAAGAPSQKRPRSMVKTSRRA